MDWKSYITNINIEDIPSIRKAIIPHDISSYMLQYSAIDSNNITIQNNNIIDSIFITNVPLVQSLGQFKYVMDHQKDKLHDVLIEQVRNLDESLPQLMLDKISSMIASSNDKDIYDALHELVLAYKVNIKTAEYRGINRAREISRLLPKNIKFDSYLDIGCGNGENTIAIRDIFNVPIDSTYGCDIKDTSSKDISYTKLEPTNVNLPYKDNFFTFETALMSLHHIPHMDTTIKEIYRTLKPGGYIVVREHDLNRSELGPIIDIMHGLYALVWGFSIEDKNFTTTYYAKYLSMDIWKQKFISAGFSVYSFPPIIQSDEWKNICRYGYMVFQKPISLVYIRDVYTRQDMVKYYNIFSKRIKSGVYVKPDMVKKLRINHLKMSTYYMTSYKDMYIYSSDHIEDKQSLTNYFIEDIRLISKNINFMSYIEYTSTDAFIKANSSLPKMNNYDRYIAQRKIIELSGARDCATFPYVVTYSIYTLFKPKRVLDMSSGWGDRLISSSLYGINTYIGVDPNSELHPRYKQMIDMYAPKKDYKMICKPFEDITDNDIGIEPFDMMFSSPPYFTTERYSSDDTQSFNRYSNIDTWLKGFMYPSLDICYKHLKVGGILAFVLSDTRQGDKIVNFTQQVLEYASTIKFTYLGYIPYLYEATSYNTKISKIVQPIWIFQK